MNPGADAIETSDEFGDEMEPSDIPEETPEQINPYRRPPGRPRKAGPGRPPKKGKNRRVETITKQTYLTGDDDGDDTDVSDDSFAPLFDSSAINERSIVRCRVIRRDPDEGMVGYIDDPLTGDNAIQEQWGGSVYRLEGLNSGGKIVAARTIKLAGDPIFKSTSAEHMWRRAKGLPPLGATTPGAAATPGMSFNELMAIQNAAEEKRRTEEREHQKAMRQMELDAEDKRRKDEDDRLRARRLDDEEREKRRQKDEDMRDERRKRDMQEAEVRQQQHLQQTIQMLQASSAQALQFAKAQNEDKPKGGTENLLEMVKTIAVIKEAFGPSGPASDEPEDTFQTLFKNLPAILNGAGGAIGSAIREVKGGGVAPGQYQLPANNLPGPLAMLPPGSPLATKLETLVTKIASQGRDPEAVLDKVADGLLAAMDAPKPATVVPDQVRAAPAPSRAEVSPDKSTAIRIPMGRKR